MMSETQGKRLGTLRCRDCKPPVIRGHAAAFKYWFNAFGHTGPYSQKVEVVDGVQKIIPKGNPMESPGNMLFFLFLTLYKSDQLVPWITYLYTLGIISMSLNNSLRCIYLTEILHAFAQQCLKKVVLGPVKM